MQGFAVELSEAVKKSGVPAEVIDIKDYDPDDQLADEVSHGLKRRCFVLIWLKKERSVAERHVLLMIILIIH